MLLQYIPRRIHYLQANNVYMLVLLLVLHDDDDDDDDDDDFYLVKTTYNIQQLHKIIEI